MKNFIILIVFLFISGTISAEQNLFIKELNLTQTNVGELKVNLKLYSPNFATYNSFSTEINGATILLKVCYNAYYLPAISNLENDFDIDIPQTSGSYILKVEVYRSATTCTYETSYLEDSAALDFTNPFEGTISLSATDVKSKDDKIMFYPNPSNGNINIKTSSPINNIKVLDISGKQISNFKNPGIKLDLTHLQNGIYFIEIISDKKKYYEKIFIKK